MKSLPAKIPFELRENLIVYLPSDVYLSDACLIDQLYVYLLTYIY